jgi:hypothetical protein
MAAMVMRRARAERRILGILYAVEVGSMRSEVLQCGCCEVRGIACLYGDYIAAQARV